MYSPSREVSCVYLHGNLIATIDKYQVEVYDGGWRTNTTKSRLNALINELCDGYNQGIYQHQFEWFIHDDNEGMQRSHAAGNIHQDIPFEHGYTFSRVNWCTWLFKSSSLNVTMQRLITSKKIFCLI